MTHTRSRRPQVQYAGVFEPPTEKWYGERTNLELAGCIALSLQESYPVLWHGLWPHGHCLNTCLSLAPLIRVSLEWPVTIAIGRAAGNRPHAWIPTPDGDIIDPTYGQFDGGPPLRVLAARDSWILGHWEEITLGPTDEARLWVGLRPRSSPRGWTEECGAFALMGDHPTLEMTRRQ